MAPLAHDDGIVGREQELATARAFARGLRDGPRALVLEGDAGIGKTAVWCAALAEAEAAGFRVLRAVADQAEARLSFAGLGDLVGALADELVPALPAPQREALEVALVRRASRSGRPPDPMAVGVGLRSLLVRAARDAPVVVAVDDVQWLDAATARALAFAARRLAGSRVGVLATTRPTAGPADVLGLARALGPDRFARARLGPIGLEPLRALIGARLGYAYRRPALLRIAQASAGNPLFALEIAHALGPDPALEPGAPLPVPEDLRELVAGHVAGLAPQARRALLVASALAHPTAALVEGASSPGALAAAEASGLLGLDGGRLAFAHPLYASAVYTSAPSERRRALHGQLAALVTDPEERVRHRALAASRPDEHVAAALAEAAAATRGRGGWETAGELLEQARALTPPALPERAWERGVLAAEHHIHAGDRPRARALLEAILDEVPPGGTRSDAQRLLAEIRYNEHGFAAAAPLLEEALAQAEEPALAVAIELDLAYVASNHLGDFTGADAHAARALAHAEDAPDATQLGEALAVHAMTGFLLGRGADWAAIARARDLEERHAGPCRPSPLYFRPSAISAVLRLWVGDHDEARAALTALRQAAVDNGDESDLAYHLSWLAWLETTTGDFAAAVALADEAARDAALAGSGYNRAWALAQRAFAHAHRGDVEAARTDAAAAAEICRRFEAMNPLLWAAGALGLLELSLGDPEAAWAALEPLTGALEAYPVGEPLTMFVPHAIEALVARGDLDRAERLLDRVEERARGLDRVPALAAAGRCRALLLAARGELREAHEATERALAEHARIDLPFERGRTLLVQGQIARRRRQKRAARESLEAARALLEPLGARLWAERAEEELSRLGRRRRTGLTASEERVAGLAVQGLSNKEIAQKLFVTVHTVEVHLSHAYAKLGVRSRTQLAGRLTAAEG